MTIGLLIPASLTGLGPRSAQGTLAAAWYAGLTVLALVFAYRDRGLGRMPSAAIIAGYLAFVTGLAISVAQGGVRPAVAVLPAAGITAVAAVLLIRPRRPSRRSGQTVIAATDGGLRRESLLRGWSARRMWRFSFILCAAVAACDAPAGPT